MDITHENMPNVSWSLHRPVCNNSDRSDKHKCFLPVMILDACKQMYRLDLFRSHIAGRFGNHSFDTMEQCYW